MKRFAATFRAFLKWVHSAAAGVNDRNEVTTLVAEVLGPDAVAGSVVTKDLPPFEHMNLQTAITAWSAVPAGPSTCAGATAQSQPWCNSGDALRNGNADAADAETWS